MFNFTKLMKFDAKVVVAEDILNEENVALISKEFANKIGVKDGKFIKLTKNGKSVCFEVKISEFAEGVDVVIPSGFFANQLVTIDEIKQFVAEAELCDGKSEIEDFF